MTCTTHMLAPHTPHHLWLASHNHIPPATDIQHNHIQQQHNGMYVYTSSVMHAVYGSIECTGGEPIFPAGCLRHNFVTPCDVHNKVSTRRGAKDKSRPRYGHARRCHTTSTCPSLYHSLHLSAGNPLSSNGQLLPSIYSAMVYGAGTCGPYANKGMQGARPH